MEKFAWPAVLLVLGILFMLIFRRQLGALIDRIQSISREGIQTSQTQLSRDRMPSSAEELMRSFDSPLLKETEKEIEEDLKKRGLANSTDAIPVLIRHLAQLRIYLWFEYCYLQIWGSQLTILNYLNVDHPTGVTMDVLESSYTNAAKLYPHAFQNYPFAVYLNFLVACQLIVEEDGRFKITVFGREFLTYLANTGKTTNKLY